MPARADAGPLINQLIAMVAAPVERPVEIGYAVTHVVNARPAPGQEPGDRPVRRHRVQQLDFGGAERQRDNGRAVHGFGRPGFQAEDVTVECEGLVEIGDGDADVRDFGVRQGI